VGPWEGVQYMTKLKLVYVRFGLFWFKAHVIWVARTQGLFNLGGSALVGSGGSTNSHINAVSSRNWVGMVPYSSL
jgi:hypothetical protein